MCGDQLAINRAFLDMRVVERVEIKQGVAKGIGSEARYVGCAGLLGADQLLNERGLGCGGLRQ